MQLINILKRKLVNEPRMGQCQTCSTSSVSDIVDDTKKEKHKSNIQHIKADSTDKNTQVLGIASQDVECKEDDELQLQKQPNNENVCNLNANTENDNFRNKLKLLTNKLNVAAENLSNINSDCVDINLSCSVHSGSDYLDNVRDPQNTIELSYITYDSNNNYSSFNNIFDPTTSSLLAENKHKINGKLLYSESIRKMKLNELLSAKQRNEDKELTFKPIINKKHKSNTQNTLPVYDRLYKKGQDYREAHDTRVHNSTLYDEYGNKLFHPKINNRYGLNDEIDNFQVDTFLYKDALDRNARQRFRQYENDEAMEYKMKASKLNFKSAEILYKKADRMARIIFQALDSADDGEVSHESILVHVGLLTGLKKYPDNQTHEMTALVWNELINYNSSSNVNANVSVISSSASEMNEGKEAPRNTAIKDRKVTLKSFLKVSVPLLADFSDVKPAENVGIVVPSSGTNSNSSSMYAYSKVTCLNTLTPAVKSQFNIDSRDNGTSPDSSPHTDELLDDDEIGTLDVDVHFSNRSVSSLNTKTEYTDDRGGGVYSQGIKRVLYRNTGRIKDEFSSRKVLSRGQKALSQFLKNMSEYVEVYSDQLKQRRQQLNEVLHDKNKLPFSSAADIHTTEHARKTDRLAQQREWKEKQELRAIITDAMENGLYNDYVSHNESLQLPPLPPSSLLPGVAPSTARSNVTYMSEEWSSVLESIDSLSRPELMHARATIMAHRKKKIRDETLSEEKRNVCTFQPETTSSSTRRRTNRKKSADQTHLSRSEAAWMVINGRSGDDSDRDAIDEGDEDNVDSNDANGDKEVERVQGSYKSSSSSAAATFDRLYKHALDKQLQIEHAEKVKAIQQENEFQAMEANMFKPVLGHSFAHNPEAPAFEPFAQSIKLEKSQFLSTIGSAGFSTKSLARSQSFKNSQKMSVGSCVTSQSNHAPNLSTEQDDTAITAAAATITTVDEFAFERELADEVAAASAATAAAPVTLYDIKSMDNFLQCQEKARRNSFNKKETERLLYHYDDDTYVKSRQKALQGVVPFHFPTDARKLQKLLKTNSSDIPVSSSDQSNVKGAGEFGNSSSSSSRSSTPKSSKSAVSSTYTESCFITQSFDEYEDNEDNELQNGNEPSVESVKQKFEPLSKSAARKSHDYIERLPPQLLIDVKLGPNRTKHIAVHTGDNPFLIASKFCRVHSLDESTCTVLTELVKRNMESNNIPMSMSLS